VERRTQFRRALPKPSTQRLSGAIGHRIVRRWAGRADSPWRTCDDLVQFCHFHGGVITALADHAAG